MFKQLGYLLAACVVSLTLTTPATAQETLGFTIDPVQGLPGGTVAGQVSPTDIAANCVTELEPFQARFQALLEGPFVGGNTEGDLPQRFFPDPMNIVYENHDQLSYVLTLAVALGIAADLGGAAQGALPQTFVMTFAEIATQEPVGELGSFDPTTGVGSVQVPDVMPGPWAVAAACVGPVFDLDLLEAGIREGGAYLMSIGAVFGADGPSSPEFIAFMQDFLDTDLEGFELLVAFVQAIGPNLLQPIVTPDALGVQIFTVLGPDTPTPTATATATPTVPPSGCPETPASGCLAPGKGNIVIKNPGNPAKSTLVWKWLKGPAATQGDFGDPVGGDTDYDLCVYAGTANAQLDIEIPGGAGWKAISTKGYKFKDSAGLIDGITKVMLKSGTAGKSKAIVKGKGPQLDLSALPLNVGEQLTVQLIRRDASTCFETVFPLASIDLDTPTKFKAKIP